LASGEISAIAAGRWGSFVLWGFAAPSRGRPIASVDIDYEPRYEDAIAAAVLRLESLGDRIDGQLTAPEIEELRTALARRRR
jgi:hypothetical protein